jgi:L-ribulose-5-phosphate 3-epimerase
MDDLGRRDFLKAAAAGAVGLAGSTPNVTQDSKPRKIRKSLKYGMISGHHTVLERFQIAKRAGFDGVEVDSPADFKPHELFAAREATGLLIEGVVDSVHWARTLGDPDPDVRSAGRAALENAVRECQRWGGSSVLLVPAVVNKTISYADAWERSQEEIRKVLPVCAEMEVTIAFENVWNHFLLSPLEAARYVDAFESKWVGWHFDVGNVVNYGWPEQWIRILGKRIKKLDVKEFSRKKRDEEGLWKGFDVEIGDGDCDWPAVRKALDEIGYTGWAAAEVKGGDEARLKEVATRMDKALLG